MWVLMLLIDDDVALKMVGFTKANSKIDLYLLHLIFQYYIILQLWHGLVDLKIIEKGEEAQNNDVPIENDILFETQLLKVQILLYHLRIDQWRHNHLSMMYQ